MKLSFLGIGSKTLLAELDAAGVAYTRRGYELDVVVNGATIVEITSFLTASTTIVGAVSYSSVDWKKARASRKIMITREDNTIFQAKGMSVKEIERVIGSAKTNCAIETKRPEASQA